MRQLAHITNYHNNYFFVITVPVAYHNSFFDDGIFPIVYSMMACDGFHQTIGECDKKTYSQFSCPRENVAGVLCGQGMEQYMSTNDLKAYFIIIIIIRLSKW